MQNLKLTDRFTLLRRIVYNYIDSINSTIM